MEKENVILDKSFQFALEIINFAELLNEKKKYLLSNQIFRSGTSIGANVREAQHAESPADFIHKLKISAKEAEETEYWLLLCKESPHYPTNEKLLFDLKEIQKILTKIIHTTKNK
ncbi:MAG: four helix bundle protein [Paludibacter sp.]